MSVNKAILIGRLGKDPELRYTPGGRAVVQFPLATSERWTDQEGQKKESTTWHNIVAWGRQAEVLKEYLSKGQQLYLEGRIDNRSYEDREGNKRYISEIVVQQFQFIGSRGDSTAARPNDQTEPEQAPSSGQSSDDDDDLPF